MTVDRHAETRPLTGAGTPASQQVSWWPTHEFITALVAQANHGTLPAAGTPSWSALADDDPRKLIALAIAGQHHVLRVEVAQTNLAEASRNVAASADWKLVAQQHRRHADAIRNGTYIPRRRPA